MATPGAHGDRGFGQGPALTKTEGPLTLQSHPSKSPFQVTLLRVGYRMFSLCSKTKCNKPLGAPALELASFPYRSGRPRPRSGVHVTRRAPTQPVTAWPR